jgi:hypothetical protein
MRRLNSPDSVFRMVLCRRRRSDQAITALPLLKTSHSKPKGATLRSLDNPHMPSFFIPRASITVGQANLRVPLAIANRNSARRRITEPVEKIYQLDHQDGQPSPRSARKVLTAGFRRFYRQ